MAESTQNFAHHARYDPLFHFFALPVVAITLILRVIALIRHPSGLSAWALVVAVAAVVVVFKVRIYALRVQDRVIRLEERLRLAGLLPDAARPKIASLTEDQLIGLRFASDAEAPALMEKALSQNLNRKQIKQAVQNWRPDYWRV